MSGSRVRIAPRIVHHAATERDRVLVIFESPPVVGHPAGDGLLVAGGSVAVAVYAQPLRDWATILASQIAGERESHSVKKVSRPVVTSMLSSVCMR
jgi:hypothetical protein